MYTNDCSNDWPSKVWIRRVWLHECHSVQTSPAEPRHERSGGNRTIHISATHRQGQAPCNKRPGCKGSRRNNDLLSGQLACAHSCWVFKGGIWQITDHLTRISNHACRFQISTARMFHLRLTPVRPIPIPVRMTTAHILQESMCGASSPLTPR
jgi:hypothetical protein